MEKPASRRAGAHVAGLAHVAGFEMGTYDNSANIHVGLRETQAFHTRRPLLWMFSAQLFSLLQANQEPTVSQSWPETQHFRVLIDCTANNNGAKVCECPRTCLQIPAGSRTFSVYQIARQITQCFELQRVRVWHGDVALVADE
ncbi:unnamed protein product, partial [Mycena citricolor]